MVDLESLRCFVAAAQTLNFGRAARSVHLSPSAFSERISRLEESLGVSLFVRSTRQIQLSLAGRVLLPKAEEMLQLAHRFYSTVADEPLHTELYLGTRYELGLSFLLPIVEELSKTHPHWTIHLYFGDAVSLCEALTKAKIDMIFGSMRLSEPSFLLQTTHLEEYRFVAAPSVAKSIQTRADLKKHSLIDISESLPLFRYWT
ncbi:MAG: LysR family transcriptional regulator, partial [Myxococcota bacterium]|nr:LysR family transcriptional regulator [Myxococcota bacterium]